MTPVEQKVSVDDQADKIMDQLVAIPLGTLAALSPALREKVHLHMTKKQIDLSFCCRSQETRNGTIWNF